MSPIFCPHCGGDLDGHDAARVGRCPSCRLVVGAGRARDAAGPEVRTGGFMANAARREAAEPAARDAVFAALRVVAADVDCAVDRLRMADYDRALRDGLEGPTIAEVLATFETWKAARAAAGARAVRQAVHPMGAPEADEQVRTG